MNCLGDYGEQSGCGSCPVALLCIDTTIAKDRYYDSLAAIELFAREMEEDLEDGKAHVPLW